MIAYMGIAEQLFRMLIRHLFRRLNSPPAKADGHNWGLRREDVDLGSRFTIFHKSHA